jgi:hypothetical protein
MLLPAYITTNNVDLTKPGTYYYAFNVSDNSGNKAEKLEDTFMFWLIQLTQPSHLMET